MEHQDPMASFWCMLFPLLISVDILLNRSQQLFASCTAKFADGQQCSIPVFDITHQTPLCEEHAKKMVSSVFSKTSSTFTCSCTDVHSNVIKHVLNLKQWRSCVLLFCFVCLLKVTKTYFLIHYIIHKAQRKVSVAPS